MSPLLRELERPTPELRLPGARIVGCRISSVRSKWLRQLTLIVRDERPWLLLGGPAEHKRTFINPKHRRCETDLMPSRCTRWRDRCLGRVRREGAVPMSCRASADCGPDDWHPCNSVQP